MRTAYLFCFGLVGCATVSDAPLPKQPDAPTSQPIVAQVGQEQDKIDARVSAAVAVAVEANDAGKPKVVKAELGVAAAYLPKASESDLAYARQRAAQSDEKAYADAVDYGRKMLARIDSTWARMEADSAQAKRVSELKDQRIAALQKEIEQVKAEASRNIFSLTGAFLIIAGGLACAFASFRTGAPLLVAGFFSGSIPFIIGSPWFNWAAGTTVVIFLSMGLFLIWERYIKAPIAVNGYKTLDEQAPPKI